MAEKLTQFSEEFPIINTTPISSKAKGYEAGEKVLDATSKVIFDVGTSLQKEASSAMFLQSQGAMFDVQSRTKVELIQSPQDAKKITDKAMNELNAIQSTAALSKEDRLKLNYYNGRIINSIKEYAVTQDAMLAQQTARYGLITSWPDNIKALQQALLSNNSKLAEDQIKSMTETVAGMLKTGALTLPQAKNFLATIKQEQDRASLVMKNYTNMNAAQFHAINSYNKDGTLDADQQPTNQHTQSIYDINSSNQLEKDIRSNLAKGLSVSPSVMMGIKGNKEFLSALEFQKGTALGNGIINSGEAYTNITREIKRLKENPARSTSEEGLYSRLVSYQNDIKNGQFLKYASETKEGSRALKELQGKLVAIEQIPDSNDVKEARQREARQDYIDSMMNVAESLHIPTEYRNIFSQSVVNDIKDNMFNADGNINNAIKSLSGIKKDSIPYLANQMGSTKQGLVTYIISNIMGKADAGFMQDLIWSSREGNDYSKLQKDKTGYSDEKIKNLVNPQLSDISSFIATQPNGPDQVNPELTKRAIDYIKFRAIKANDYTFSNIDTYSNDFVNNISRVYQPHAFFNGQIDLNVIPVQPEEANHIMSYAIEETYTKLREYMNESEFQEYISRNPVSAISTPTGRIVVVGVDQRAVPDKNGNAAFDHLYNLNMLQVAKSRRLIAGANRKIRNVFLGRDSK